MGLGIPELIIILVIVLIIFGPRKLPGLGSGVGDALRNFRKAVNRPDAIDVTPPDEEESDSARPDKPAGSAKSTASS